MITELALERVTFTCGHCWHEWSTDYDVSRYRDGEGHDWEYFSHDGVTVVSPYTTAGALPCPQCGRRWIGRLLARRPIPTPPGPQGTPRQEIIDSAGHRPERREAPLLAADAHVQPKAAQQGIE
ncbi:MULTISPECIES: hypothetical protein [Streptomyces]|uniref:Uncharacterized protein n=1 Tax=Streptomyces siderophoricus TaxID=2802281 RepID=A0ABS1N255_9ACTN|nr:hypothetical protein [Streptomyces sp. 9-7]MBL1094019.1 hypothetical protein [Streptomyces sp. 9-7]